MKLAVILGVTQMSLGIVMKAINSLHYGKMLDFYFEFIPQIILLSVLFGFMDLLIVIKWLTNYETIIGADPPSIITTMITMCLNFGIPPPGKTSTPFIQNQTQVM